MDAPRQPPAAAARAGGQIALRLGATPLILIAMTGFALQDVTVKLVAGSISIWQMQLIRSAAVLGLLVVVVHLLGRRHELIPTRWRWPLLRALVMTGAYLMFYSSLPFLPLAEAGAAFYVGPLLITLLAALLLGEPIGPRRVAAVIAGFLGVLMIVRPGMEGFRAAALLPVGAATCYALAVVMTRWRCRDQPSFALTFTHNLLYTGLGGLGILAVPLLGLAPESRAAWPFLLEGWLPLGGLALVLLLATAVTHLVGMLASLAAYKAAEASRIAPFEYAYLPMMGALDLAIWGAVPDPLSLAGMALIVGAGMFVAWREGRPVRPRVQFRGETPWTPDHADDKKGP
ncbi:DMT family transporter [Paralimibaculum aggregatum]|uniref:DMT family transporter n=1 Tax=Paralimibaculum aggregatum TaxID=3036245 RepID=A0ABQ6LFU6_9RHOB|nr:DMT family transporter [Limibaculum sp. NKW23]GMG82200.1 DMT family transporter [Limibaculum sp. NKW23]